MPNEVNSNFEFKNDKNGSKLKTNAKIPGFDLFASNFHHLLNTVSFEIKAMNSKDNKLTKSHELNGSLENYAWDNLTNSQKQLALDVLCWKKGDFNSACMAELLPILLQAIKTSPSFAVSLFYSYELHLFLKTHFNFYQFDTEEQNYPEDDRYFMTKDFSFVFQYDHSITSTSEIEEVLEQILMVVGHEKFISKLNLSAAESFMSLQEEAYNHRNNRLQEISYPYYEAALEWQTPIILPNIGVDYKTSIPAITNVTTAGTNFDLTADQDRQVSNIENSLELHSLIQTVQAVFEFNQANDLDLGIDGYVKKFQESMQEVLYFIKVGENFQRYFNMDLHKGRKTAKVSYRVGKTVFNQMNKDISILRKNIIQDGIEWNFLGDTIQSLADDITLVSSRKSLSLTKFFKDNYRPWSSILEIKTFINSLIENYNVIKAYWFKYSKIKNEISTSSVNFNNDTPSLETLYLTGFVSYVLNGVSDEYVSWEQAKNFTHRWKKLSDNNDRELQRNYIVSYLNTLGITEMYSKCWLAFTDLLVESELSGELDLDIMSHHDLKHIGSVIIKKTV